MPHSFPHLPSGAVKHTVHGQTWWLLPQKAVYWAERRMLVVADVHVGKDAHFRRHGIPVGDITRSDLSILSDLADWLAPESCTILGDLFHTRDESAWQQFEAFASDHPDLEFNLVPGNHDAGFRADGGGNVHLQPAEWVVGPFLFSHHPLAEGSGTTLYPVYGHVHPAVLLKGRAHSRLRLPAFVFGPAHAMLPAFGNFTGTHVVRPDDTCHVFALADGHVVRV